MRSRLLLRLLVIHPSRGSGSALDAVVVGVRRLLGLILASAAHMKSSRGSGSGQSVVVIGVRRLLGLILASLLIPAAAAADWPGAARVKERLSSANPELRRQAIDDLKSLPAAEALPLFAQAAADPVATVAAYALQTLPEYARSLDPKEVVKAAELLFGAYTKETRGEVREAAVEALAALPLPGRGDRQDSAAAG